MERVLTRLFQLTEPVRLNSKILTREELDKSQDVLKMIQKLNELRSTQKNDHSFSDEVMEELKKKKYIEPSELASYYLHTVGERCNSFEDFRREQKPNKKLKKLTNLYHGKKK